MKRPRAFQRDLPRTLATDIGHRPIMYDPVMPTLGIEPPRYRIMGTCPALIAPAMRLSEAHTDLMSTTPPMPDVWPVKIAVTPHPDSGDLTASIDCGWCFKSSMVDAGELVDFLNTHIGSLGGRLKPAHLYDKENT